MDLPRVVSESGLFISLQRDPELLAGLTSIRVITEKIAATVAQSVPAFTDHSIRHMDGLWRVCDSILTPPELDQLSTAEAFLLASGFYLHDIGMAYAATTEGLSRICSSSVYKGVLSAFPEAERTNPMLVARATALAVRKAHENAPLELATAPVPGTKIYIFESPAFRDAWGDTCGRIAASHHLTLEAIERELGVAGQVPLPGGRRGDLAYVASVLRLVDYAHINRDRAPTIDRALRRPFEYESLVHWLAQEGVDGPSRDGNDLVYRAAVPIANVDAWWLYYQMLTGLDAEIRAVKRYLDRRSTSSGRLSLQGVRGAVSPEEAAQYIPTTGFLPIEVHLRTGSIDRLVKLLAGESLYGPDPMAAVRELVQNALDAVKLKAAVASTALDEAALKIPIRISLATVGGRRMLQVTDWGIGMTRKVMTDYLLSIASDYWSSQFYIDFPSASDRGFRPAGKFGIGFLSVFMLGDDVIVESNRDGGERSRMSLSGMERRGEIRAVPSPSGSGTSIHILLRDAVLDSLRPLADLVRVYAPMASHTLQIDVDGQSTTIAVGWLRDLPCEEFYSWTLGAIRLLSKNREWRPREEREYYLWNHPVHGPFFRHRVGRGDEEIWIGARPEHTEPRVRLAAAFEGVSLLCLKGLALQPISTPGFVGVIDVESATPDVSRRRAIDADVGGIIERAIKEVRTQIVTQFNSRTEKNLLIDELGFIARCVTLYGREPLLESSIPWINLLRMPGEVQLINSADFLSALRQSRSLFVSYGTGPWTAMRQWVEVGSEAGRAELAIVLDDAGQASPAYVPDREEKVGRLDVLWPKCERTPLFGTILRLAAEAWQVNLQTLMEQDGWRHKGSVVSGCFTRPDSP